MEVFLTFAVFVFVVYLMDSVFPKWKFKLRYPVISTEFPAGEMKRGDIIVLGKTEYEYRGFDNVYSHKDIFLREGITEASISPEEIRERATCLKCQYGVKWSVYSFLFNSEDIHDIKKIRQSKMKRKINYDSPLYSELKSVGFEVLLTNPGINKKEWVSKLCIDYSLEVGDALGMNSDGTFSREVYESLDELWSEVYHDEASNLTKTFDEWADEFCDETSVDLYYRLIEAKKE